jgi:hypothetical protein
MDGHHYIISDKMSQSGFDFLAYAIFISQYHTEPPPSIALHQNRDHVWWVLQMYYDAK